MADKVVKCAKVELNMLHWRSGKFCLFPNRAKYAKNTYNLKLLLNFKIVHAKYACAGILNKDFFCACNRMHWHSKC